MATTRSTILGLALLMLCAAAGAETITALYTLSASHETKRVSGETVARDVGKFRDACGFDYGTSTQAAEINAVWSVRGEVSSSSAAAYNLLSLTDKFGDALAFSRVKAFAVKNLSAADSLIIGSGTTSFTFGQATATAVTVPPMGSMGFSSPLAGFNASVTASVVNIISDGGVASFDLVIMGLK